MRDSDLDSIDPTAMASVTGGLTPYQKQLNKDLKAMAIVFPNTWGPAHPRHHSLNEEMSAMNRVFSADMHKLDGRHR